MPIPPTEKFHRLSFFIPKWLKQHIQEFQFQNYIQNKGEALRRLIKSGLLHEHREGNYHPKELPLNLGGEKNEEEEER